MINIILGFNLITNIAIGTALLYLYISFAYKFTNKKFIYFTGWSYLAQAGITFGYTLMVFKNSLLIYSLGLIFMPLMSTIYILLIYYSIFDIVNKKVSKRILVYLGVALFILFYVLVLFSLLKVAQLLFAVLCVAAGLIFYICFKSFKRNQNIKDETLLLNLINITIVLLGLNQFIYVMFYSGENAVVLQSLIETIFRVIIGFLLFLVAIKRIVFEIDMLNQKNEGLGLRSKDGILILGKKNVLYINPSILNIFNLNNVSNGVKFKDLLRHIDVETKKQIKTNIRNNDSSSFVFKFKDKDQVKYIKGNVENIIWGNTKSIQLNFTDETDIYNKQKKIDSQELIDELTLLNNRNAMLKIIKTRCSGYLSEISDLFEILKKDEIINISNDFTKDKISGFFIILIDLDRFKNFNETMGYVFGDKVLQVVGNILATIAPTCNVFRLGEDEFAIVSKDDTLKPEDICSKIKKRFSVSINIDGGSFFIDLSMGISQYPNDGIDSNDLLKKADFALDMSKKQPGTFFNFAPSNIDTNNKIKNLFNQEQSIRNSLNHSDFFLLYQPKVNAKTFEIESVEALVRWNNNNKLINPIEFIEVAEKIGLIEALGNYIIREACVQIKNWELQNVKSIPVAINISPLQLLNPMFAENFHNIIVRNKVNPKNVQIEITESSAMQSLELTISHVNKLKSFGYIIAMDDFGTGYSSLNVLRNIPLDIVKIDRGLISPLPEAGAVAIIKAICDMAKVLGMKIVAEGVETKEQAEICMLSGCDLLQGYYFSKPINGNDYKEILKDDNYFKKH